MKTTKEVEENIFQNEYPNQRNKTHITTVHGEDDSKLIRQNSLGELIEEGLNTEEMEGKISSKDSKRDQDKKDGDEKDDEKLDGSEDESKKKKKGCVIF